MSYASSRHPSSSHVFRARAAFDALAAPPATTSCSLQAVSCRKQPIAQHITQLFPATHTHTHAPLAHIIPPIYRTCRSFGFTLTFLHTSTQRQTKMAVLVPTRTRTIHTLVFVVADLRFVLHTTRYQRERSSFLLFAPLLRLFNNVLQSIKAYLTDARVSRRNNISSTDDIM